MEREYVPVTTPDEARRAVAQAAFAGADLIKVIVDTGLRENHFAVLDESMLRAIVEEAHRSRLKVAAHAIANVAVHKRRRGRCRFHRTRLFRQGCKPSSHEREGYLSGPYRFGATHRVLHRSAASRGPDGRKDRFWLGRSRQRASR